MDKESNLSRPDVSLGSSRRVSYRYRDLSKDFDCPACGAWVEVNTHCSVCGRLFVLPELPVSQQTFTVLPDKAHGVQLPAVDHSGQQSDLIDLEYGSRDSLPVDLLSGLASNANKQSAKQRKELSWKYDEPQYREAVLSGQIVPDHEEICYNYLDWLDHEKVVNLRDLATGDRCRKQSSKRGNLAYANKKKKQVKYIDQGIDALASENTRDGFRGVWTRELFVTFNENPNYVFPDDLKLLTSGHRVIPKGTVLSEMVAWSANSTLINKFKANIRKFLIPKYSPAETDKQKADRKALVKFYRFMGFNVPPKPVPKVRLDVLSVKEACGGDGPNKNYPHDHAIIILPHPVLLWTDGNKYMIEDRNEKDGGLRAALKSFWPYGFLDIQGIVAHKFTPKDGEKPKSATQYALKYAIEAVRARPEPHGNHGVHVRSMALTKHYRVNFFTVTKHLRDTLSEYVRVHLLLSTLKPAEAHFWRFESVINCRSDEIIRYLVERELSPLELLLKTKMGREIYAMEVASHEEYLAKGNWAQRHPGPGA